MNWFTRNWRPLAIGAAGLVGAAVAIGLFTPSKSTQERPLLVGYRHGGQSTYLAAQAQGWLTCPAAATKCYRWKMNEASGNLTDDLSGDSAVLTASGTPVYRVHTPIPTSTGFDRRAIWFNGTNSKFVAGNSAVADYTTNNISASFVLCGHTNQGAGVYPGIIGKGLTNQAGWWITYDQNNGNMQVWILGTAPATYCAVELTPPLDSGCHFYTVNLNRAANAYAYKDGVSLGVNCNISAEGASVSNAAGFTIGYSTVGHYLKEGVSEVLVANGLTTLAEHQAYYRAFKVPSTVSYTQTTTRKFPLPPEAGFGERLGTYGGSATNPQWPVRYASGKKATTLGTDETYTTVGFPAFGPTTNVIGYANEFNSWSGAAAVAVNTAEAPDGSMTADVITYSSDTTSKYKAVVGAGVIGAGERWCSSIFYKVISGSCTSVFLAAAITAGPYEYFANTSTWTRKTACGPAAGANKGIILYAVTHNSCVLAVADAQYEANNVTDPCTSTAGDVSQTCNAPLLSADWSAKSALMPTSLSRGEVIIKAIVEPWVYAPGMPRVAWHTGNESAYVAEAVEPVFVLKGQGGDAETVVKGKPIRHENRYREYVASWDQAKEFGLTNTSPRKYAGMSIDGSYASAALASRHTTSTAGQLDPVTPPSQKDYLSTKLYVGCPATNSSRQCLQGTIEDWGWYARPEQKVKIDDSDLLVAGGFSGADFLRAQAIPRFECPAGVDSSNCWIWDMSGYSGSQYDRVNGVALAPTGSPRYQAWTGLMARGQGRRGVKFTQSGAAEAISASSNAIGSIAGNTVTFGAIFSGNRSSLGENEVVYGSIDLAEGGGAGYAILNASSVGSGCPMCAVGDADGSHYSYSFGSAATGGCLPAGLFSTIFVVCTATKATGTWVVTTYSNGLPSVIYTLSQATGSIANNSRLRVGATPALANARSFNGMVSEAFTDTAEYTAADVLALYKQTTQMGGYLNFASIGKTPLVHYKMNEPTLANGVGLRDHSGNGNHLTVVAGTPDPQYKDMPWPAGAGLTKVGTEYSATTDLHSGGATAGVPSDTGSFSVLGWVRMDPIAVGNWNLINKATAAEAYTFQLVSGKPYLYWTMHDAAWCSAYVNSDLRDGLWHLIAGKVTYSGGTWTPAVSVDGAAFGGTITTCAGSTVAANDAVISIGQRNTATPLRQVAGAAIIKNYALTDAEVLAYYKAGASPLSTLTYARTNRACYDVGNDPVDGVKVRCFKAGDVGFGYSSSLTARPGNRMGLGEMVHGAVTNYQYYSDALGSWTPLETTVGSNVAPAPDGAMTADSIIETVVNSPHYLYVRAQAAVQNDLATATCSYRKGANTRWVSCWVYDGVVAGARGFANVDLDTASLGTVGSSSGVHFDTVSATIKGVVGGWITVTVKARWINAAPTTIYGLTALLRSNAANGTETYAGNVGYYVYAANMQAMVGHSNPPGIYCPNPANSSTTCNAVTSNNVAAANMTSWTRAQGAVSCVASASQTSTAWMLTNSVPNSNGIHYGSTWPSTIVIYDSAGNLVQQQSQTTQVAQTARGNIWSWDSVTAYNGTRRVFGVGLDSNYAGINSTFTADTGAWTPAASTNLYLGHYYNLATPVNGPLESCYVFKTR